MKFIIKTGFHVSSFESSFRLWVSPKKQKQKQTKTNKKIDSKRQVFYVCVSVGGCNVSLWPEWGQRLFGICLLRKSKLRAACWGDVSFRVWGHHRSFCVGRGVEGVKAVRNGPGGKPSSQNRPSLHSEEIADLNALLWRLDYFGDEDWQYFFFSFFFFLLRGTTLLHTLFTLFLFFSFLVVLEGMHAWIWTRIRPS